MELGNIPKIDQFKDNKAVEMQQVKSTSNLAKTDEQKELKEIQKKSIDQARETQMFKKLKMNQLQRVNMKWYFQIQILDLIVALKIFL